MANQNGPEHGYQDPRDQRARETGRDDRGKTDYRERSDIQRNPGYGLDDGAMYRGQSGAQAGGNYDQAWNGQGVRGGSEGRWGDMDRGGRSRGPHAGKGPQGFQRTDARIKELVQEALTDDEHLDATHLIVDVKDGEVTLTGTVEDRQAKRHAEDITESISGVKDVHNTIKLQSSQPTDDKKLRH